MNRKIIVSIILAMILMSCSDEVKRGLQPIPSAFGKINTIEVITDKGIWEGPVGDTLRFYYSAAYPILPQPEPIFDLRHFTPADLNKDPIRKELRNYLIIANLNDTDSPTTRMVLKDIGEEKARRAQEDQTKNSTVGRDKWASGQLLIYQYGYSEDALMGNLKRNFTAISKKIREADESKVEATAYLDGRSRKLEKEVQEKMGAQMRIPNDYFKAISDDQVIWIRKETQDLSSNIMLSKVPYTDQSQLTKEGIKEIRNRLGKEYISSTLPDTYMQINDIDLPMFTTVETINNNYALEARGIWEIVNDYMGGSFISYLIYNENKQELLFVDGFVHAPGKDKRDFMEQLEYIINTIKY